MKTVLITGASRGIGAETAKEFAKNGWTVLINYNKSQSQVQELQRQLTNLGCDVHLMQADLSNPCQVEQMFEKINKLFHRLDVLVNNAGQSLYSQLQDVTVLQFDQLMAVNARAPFLCSQKAVDLFLKQGSGAIVNVSSIWGLQGASCESVYSMSKFALIGLTLSLHEEIGDFVNVNCVCPSIVATDMCAHLTDEELTAFLDEHCGRILKAEEVAKSIYEVATTDQSGRIIEIK